MNVASVSLAAKETAWIRPANSALLALTTEEQPSDTDWHQQLLDPAFVAHLLRFARPSLPPLDSALSSDLALQPALALQAANFLKQTHRLALLPDSITTTLLAAADLARQLANPEEARWASALCSLPALGWLALLQLGEAIPPTCPIELSQQLLTRWRVPNWVSAIIAGLRLLPEDAERIGAPASLFRTVQTALATAEARFGSLGITNANAGSVSNLFVNRSLPTPPDPAVISDELLLRLLRQSANARRASAALWLHEAEEREQQLLNTLAQARAEFADQVQEARLSGLAEFAAGASHEINNPLAVISGHAQLLLHGEADPARQRQLSTIIRQTRRIDEILHGTRQFARPLRPKATRFLLIDWAKELEELFESDLQAKKIEWHCDFSDDLYGQGDVCQLRQALIHLVRNAIEAAPEGGSVRLSAIAQHQRLSITVEDTGNGPSFEHRPYLFDPFFSGRSAGRGRGLGLPIAWRLATINNGSVRYVPTESGPTRFCLEFPQAADEILAMPSLDRLSA